MSWKSSVVGYLERGTTWCIAGVNEAFPPDENSHLTWGVVWVDFPKLTPEIFKDIIENYNVVDTIDATTMAIKLFQDPTLLNPGPTPAVVSEAEITTPPSGEWWHLNVMESRNTAYPILDELHKKYSAELYWMIDMYPLKLAKVMTLAEFSKLFAEQHQRDASPTRK
jgi:hypothetical protein